MKNLRFLGMALLAMILCVNLVGCSDDDGEEHGKMTKVIHVETAGTLSTLMSKEEQVQVTDLTLSGYINGTDVRFIQKMISLTKADFTDLHIVGGGDNYGDSYYYDNYTQDNVFPAGLFFFGECEILNEVKLPNSVTKIGDGAFGSCTSLTSVEIPNSVTKIGDGAFLACTSLTAIEIPDGVTEIKYETFGSCTSLTSVEIPNSVTEIEYSAFLRCN